MAKYRATEVNNDVGTCLYSVSRSKCHELIYRSILRYTRIEVLKPV